MIVNLNLKKGQVLMNEGNASDCLYILRSGELSIYKYDRESQRHNVIAHVQPGEMVGEMSFLDNSPRSASVKANTDCELSMFNRAAFEKLFASQDPMMQELVKTLADRLRRANQKIKL